MGRNRPVASGKSHLTRHPSISEPKICVAPRKRVGRHMVAASELNYTSNASAMQMAQAIFGDGVTVVDADYTGWKQSSAIYSGGDTIAPGVTPGDTGVILSTGRASHFTNSKGQANQSSSKSTNTNGPDNQADFNEIAGTQTYDASYLDVDFIPTGDTMTLQFVFSSDEYPEYSGSIYNDVVGVWINGEHVPVSVISAATQVGEVNQVENENLFIDNTNDDYNTEMDGFTVTMTLTIPVNEGEENSIRIGIADVSDNRYDSNLLIAGDSAQTTLIAEDDHFTIKEDTTKQSLDILGNDQNHTAGALVVTHVNGQAVVAGDSVTLATGHVITLNADGTIDVQTDLDHDTASFTYQVAAQDGAGATLQSDVGFVTVETIPCFVTGTSILTPNGEVKVEDLTVGDLVMTQDDGPQRLRWVGRRVVQAVGKMAPIRIAQNTFGQHRALMVSPLHRILIEDFQAELLFGEPQVLVAAKDLVNDKTVRPVEGGEVEYVHIMFDKHQVVFSEGLPTESFLPGPQTSKAFEAEIVAEICAIFPELDPTTGQGYSPAARRTLKRYEAELFQAGRAA